MQQQKYFAGSSLLLLAKRRKFDEIMELLNGPGYHRLLDECMKSRDESLNLFVGPSPLHILVRYCPPVELVDRMIQRIIEYTNDDMVPEDSLDPDGRCPLHVAVLSGCDHSVIVRLLSGVTHILPAVSKDSFDRTPLHYACANGKGSKHSFLSPRRRNVDETENTFLTVRALVRAYPEAVEIKDCKGKTPWDLALEHKAERRILYVLEAASLMQMTQKDGPHHNSFTETSSEIILFDAESDISTIGNHSFCPPCYNATMPTLSQTSTFISQSCEI
jgi:ankyrin repeat protein